MVPEPVDLMQFSKEELKKFLDSFDYVFSDCDGVIWSKGPLPRTGEFIALMKKLGKKVHYVSNNSVRSNEGYVQLFKASGIENGFNGLHQPPDTPYKTTEICTYYGLLFLKRKSEWDSRVTKVWRYNQGRLYRHAGDDILEENLTIPSVAIAEYLKSQGLTKKVYCVSCPHTARQLETYGFTCEEGPDIGSDNYMDYIQYLLDDLQIGAVVFDSDYKINLPKLYRAITYLKRPDVHFISGATDRLVPLSPGTIALGVGVFTDIVKEQVKRDPVQLGKPGRLFGEFAMKRAGAIDPSRVLFIGDMIEQDVGLGKAVGFKTLLVLSNETKENMMSHKTIKPDYFAPNLGSIVPLLEDLLC